MFDPYGLNNHDGGLMGSARRIVTFVNVDVGAGILLPSDRLE